MPNTLCFTSQMSLEDPIRFHLTNISNSLVCVSRPGEQPMSIKPTSRMGRDFRASLSPRVCACASSDQAEQGCAPISARSRSRKKTRRSAQAVDASPNARTDEPAGPSPPKSRAHASAPANTIRPLRAFTPALMPSASLLFGSGVRCRQSSKCLQMFFGLLHAV
jgi:hypothetical protein